MRELNPDTIRPPFARYAHGVEVPAGARLVVTSGQLGIGDDEIVPPGAAEQAALCFANCAPARAKSVQRPVADWRLRRLVWGCCESRVPS